MSIIRLCNTMHLTSLCNSSSEFIENIDLLKLVMELKNTL